MSRYCSKGGWPFGVGISPVSKRVKYARMNATMPEQGVGDDMEGDQQPVVALYHRCPAGALIVSSMV